MSPNNSRMTTPRTLSFGYGVIETYVPVSEDRLASQVEQEREAGNRRSALC